MKKMIIILLAFFIFFIFIKCDNDAPTNGNNPDGSLLSAKINGDSWVSTKASFNEELGVFRKVFRIISEKGTEKIELVLQFIASDTIKAGKYVFETEGDYFAIYHQGEVSDTSFIGSVTIIEYERDDNYQVKAIGNFSFVVNSGNKTYEFTEGKFDSTKE